MLVEQEARIVREAGLFGGLMYVGAAAAAGAIVVSGGTLAAGITAAVLAGGAGVPHRLSPGQMDRRSTCALSARADGSWRLLLWVRTWDAEDERRAVEILRKHSGGGVHVHALPAA